MSESRHLEEAEEIKNKFIKTMKWSSDGNRQYDQEDVKTIVLGNLNTITHRFAEALLLAEAKGMERAAVICEHFNDCYAGCSKDHASAIRAEAMKEDKS